MSDLPEIKASDILTNNNKTGIIGRGNFGAVRLCKTKQLKEIVVKCFPLSGIGKELDEKARRLKNEARTLRLLSHKYIVKLYGICLWPNSFGIVMEYIPGGNLDQFLQRVNVVIPWSIKLRTAVQLSEAIYFLHNSNPTKVYIHGDIKPENILISINLTVKLADFGSVNILRLSGASTTNEEQPKSRQHTPLYTAPEFLKNVFADRTTAMDIYSFGMVLYEIITRVRIYDNASLPRPQVIQIICDTGQRPNPDPIEEVKKCLEEESIPLFNVILKTMESSWSPNPEDRANIETVYISLQEELLKISKETIHQQVQQLMKKLDLKCQTVNDECATALALFHYPFEEPEIFSFKGAPVNESLKDAYQTKDLLKRRCDSSTSYSLSSSKVSKMSEPQNNRGIASPISFRVAVDADNDTKVANAQMGGFSAGLRRAWSGNLQWSTSKHESNLKPNRVQSAYCHFFVSPATDIVISNSPDKLHMWFIPRSFIHQSQVKTCLQCKRRAILQFSAADSQQLCNIFLTKNVRGIIQVNVPSSNTKTVMVVFLKKQNDKNYFIAVFPDDSVQFFNALRSVVPGAMEGTDDESVIKQMHSNALSFSPRMLQPSIPYLGDVASAMLNNSYFGQPPQPSLSPQRSLFSLISPSLASSPRMAVVQTSKEAGTSFSPGLKNVTEGPEPCLINVVHSEDKVDHGLKLVWSGILEMSTESFGVLQGTRIPNLLNCQVLQPTSVPNINTEKWPGKLNIRLLPQLINHSALQSRFKSMPRVILQFSAEDSLQLRNKFTSRNVNGLITLPLSSSDKAYIIVSLERKDDKYSFLGVLSRKGF